MPKVSDKSEQLSPQVSITRKFFNFLVKSSNNSYIGSRCCWYVKMCRFRRDPSKRHFLTKPGSASTLAESWPDRTATLETLIPLKWIHQTGCSCSDVPNQPCRHLSLETVSLMKTALGSPRREKWVLLVGLLYRWTETSTRLTNYNSSFQSYLSVH
jgi:hypothetical protein